MLGRWPDLLRKNTLNTHLKMKDFICTLWLASVSQPIASGHRTRDRALSEPPVGLSGTVWFHSSLLMLRNKVSLCEDWFLCIIIHSLYKHLLPKPHLPLVGYGMCQAVTECAQFIHVRVNAAGPNSVCAAPLGTAGQVQASIAFALNSAPFISNF